MVVCEGDSAALKKVGEEAMNEWKEGRLEGLANDVAMVLKSARSRGRQESEQ